VQIQQKPKYGFFTKTRFFSKKLGFFHWPGIIIFNPIVFDTSNVAYSHWAHPADQDAAPRAAPASSSPARKRARRQKAPEPVFEEMGAGGI